MSSRALLSALLMLAISFCPAFASQDQAKARSSLSGRITNPAGAVLTVKLKPIEKDPLGLYDGYSAQAAPNGPAQQRAFTILSSQEIIVGDADVDGIIVAPDPLASISGQLRFEDLTAAKACPTREKTFLRIQKEDDGQFQDLELSADGKFSFPHVPIGAYSIQLHPFLRGASYIKSILLDGNPVEGRRIEIGSAASHSLELTLSSDAARSAGHIPPEDPFERFQAEGTHPKASLSGHVKNAQPDPPLVKLWALRFNSDRSYEYSTKPQPDGSFRFENVDPGIYLLLTQGSEYALSEYGAPYPRLEGTALTLKAGQHLDGLILNAAQKQPSLCGRVTDEGGKPVPNVSVLASASPRVIDSFGPIAATGTNTGAVQSAASEGVVILGPPQATTDKDGNFRFFDLKPGDYFLWTDFLVPSGQTWARHWAYFPSSPNMEGAQTVRVSYAPDSGCSHNLHVQTPKTFHVRGTVPRDLAHGQDEFFTVELVETSAAGVEGLAQSKNLLAPGAAFDFADVTSGRFRLHLRGPYRKPREGSVIEWSGPSCAFASRFAASGEIRVRDADLNDVTLDVIPTLSVAGQFRFEHIPAEWRALHIEEQRVTLSPVDDFFTERGAQLVPMCSQTVQVSTDGKFKFDNLTGGTYRVDVELTGVQGDALFLKSIALNGRPIEGRRIKLKQGPPAELALVVSNDGGEVDVRVQASGPPADEYRYDEPCQPRIAVTPKALLIPDKITPDGSGIITGWFTSAGQVEIPRVPPGRYFALAGDNFDFHFAQWQLGNSPWSDPKFLNWAKALGTRVDVAPGQKIKLSLASATSQIQDLLAKYMEDVRVADHCASSCSYDGFWTGIETAQIHQP